MRKTSTLALIAAVAVQLVSGRVAAVDYFPSDPTATFDYTYGPVSFVAHGVNEFARIICATCVVGSSRSYRTDPTGDIYETQYGYFAQAAPDPDLYLLEPNLLYLDFPLDTGKQWQSTAQVNYYLGAVMDTVSLSGHVIGPRTVTVPAGEFEVIEVELNYVYAVDTWRSQSGVLWLHRQLGPVNGLLSWTGIIPNANANWGSVKAQFR